MPQIIFRILRFTILELIFVAVGFFFFFRFSLLLAEMFLYEKQVALRYTALLFQCDELTHGVI